MKLIIDNQSDLEMSEALRYAASVVRMGRISNGGQNYCYASTFDDGIEVLAFRNKSSDRIVVYRKGDEK